MYSINRIFGISLMVSLPAFADEPASDTLVSALLGQQGAAQAVAVASELRAELISGNAEQVASIQSRLCQELGATTDPASMKRIAHVLAAAPSAEALQIGLTRLDPGLPVRTRVAACELIARVAEARSPADTASAIDRLGGVLNEEGAPADLIDGALLATAAFGPDGMDTMLKAGRAGTPVREKSNVLYSALARTGDLRALPFLRDALADRRSHSGLRIQATHAMGQLAETAVNQGEQINPIEHAACVRILLKMGSTAEEDQLYAVAIQSLCRFEDVRHDPAIHAMLVAGLDSSSVIRQEAALQALYEQDSEVLDSSLLEAVGHFAANGQTESCRATAQAILDKYEAEVAFEPQVP